MINLTHADLKDQIENKIITFKRISRSDSEHPLSVSDIYTTNQNEFIQLTSSEVINLNTI